MDSTERKETTQQALVYVGVTVATALILVLLWYAIDVVLLAFVGVLLAILLRAPADWLSSKTGIRSTWTLALVVLLGVALLAAALLLFGRTVIAQGVQLADRVPEIIESLREQLQATELGDRAVEMAESSGALAGGETQFIGRGLGLIGSTFGALANVLIVLFFGIFLAAQPQVYLDGVLHLVVKRRRQRAQEVLLEIGAVLRRWIVGQAALSLCVALVIGIGLLLLGAPFAVPLALLAGIMEFVPYIGPFIAAIPAILVAFAERPELAAWVAALYFGVQLLESYVLAPLIQQRAVHLPPAMVIFMQVLMGVLVGALGVAVATPLAAAIMVTLSMLYVEDALGDPVNNRST